MLPFRMFLIRMFPVRVFPDRMFRFRIMHKNIRNFWLFRNCSVHSQLRSTSAL